MNALILSQEMAWLTQCVAARLAAHTQGQDIELPAPPDLNEHSIADFAPYPDLVIHYQMNTEERLVLALALAPRIQPSALDLLMMNNNVTNRPFTEFGGMKAGAFTGFLPTIETVYFLLAGMNMSKRLNLIPLLSAEHFLFKHGILDLQRPQHAADPPNSALLTLTDEYSQYLLTGEEYSPRFSMDFPAKRLTTGMTWEDLVLNDEVLRDLRELHAFLAHGETLLQDWGMANRLAPGYKCLFYGPSGTGKTITAALLGKRTGREVWRIDLSQVVSKYIGETEKNLSLIFDRAERQNWLLFFDEADALFGKRTATNDSKDRHANQEVAYLLQRIEDYAGVVILATNLKTNMDTALLRRFQAVVHFPAPDASQRLRLWERAFPSQVVLAADVSLPTLAAQYAITGGAMVNVVRHALLAALERGDNIILLEDLHYGIQRELTKEGKTG